MRNRGVDLAAQAEGPSKIVDLATFRRGRSVENWFLALSVFGFVVLTGMFAAKVSPLLGAGGLSDLMQWVR